MSHRPASKVPDDALLDAALANVLAVGVRRTTLTDVARRAGVSRMTVYRRFPDVTSLVAALLTREFTALLAAAAAQVASVGAVRDPRPDGTPDARRQLVAATVHLIRSLADDPLLRVVLQLDAALLLPYLVERIGQTQRIAEQFLVEQIAAGHRDGSIRTGLPAAQARTFFLTAQAAVISLRPATTDLPLDDLLAELAAQLDGALRPDRTEESS